METEQEFSPLVRAVGVIDENKNFIPYGSTAVAKGIPVFVFNTKEEYDEHAPTLPEPCVVITLDDIDTGGFEFDGEIDPESENAVQNKVIAAALEALRDKANFDRPGMVQFTDATDVTNRDGGLGLSAIEKNASVVGTLANKVQEAVESLGAIGGVVQGEKFKAYIEAGKEGVIGEITLPPGLWYIACSGWTPLGYQAVINLGHGSWHGTQCATNRLFNFSAVLYNGQQTTRELWARNLTTENLESVNNYEFYAVRLK